MHTRYTLPRAFLAILLLFSMNYSASAVGLKESIKEPVFIHKKYTGQNELSCNGNKYNIPTYFPLNDKLSLISESDFYLGAIESECSDDAVHLYLGLGKNCTGANTCTHATFSYSKVSEAIQSRLYSSLNVYTKKIELVNDQVGYFVPPQCNAYCDEAKIIWFKPNYIFIIGLKTAQKNQETIDELTKSANSYILQEKFP